MRVAGLDVDFSKKLTSVTRGTYNSWFKSTEFAVLYHQLPNLIQDYRLEAIQLLRKDNQLEAVLLEGKIISKMKEEIETGEYILIRTNLAREVYSKLLTNLDATPDVKVISWHERVEHLYSRTPEQIEEGDAIDGEFSEVSSEPKEHQEGKPISKGQSPNDEATQTATE